MPHVRMVGCSELSFSNDPYVGAAIGAPALASLHEVGTDWPFIRSRATRQARWPDESPLLMLPGLDAEAVARLQRSGGWRTLPDLLRALHSASRNATLKMLRQDLGTTVLRPCAAVHLCLHPPIVCAACDR